MPTTSIHDVLAQLRERATSERDKGELFERLMQTYLRTDPTYVGLFSEVWLWEEWPGRDGKPDTGIDLVARERTGGLCAIQAKFYDPTHYLDKGDIDSFFTARTAPLPCRSVAGVETTRSTAGSLTRKLKHHRDTTTRGTYEVALRSLYSRLTAPFHAGVQELAIHRSPPSG